MLRSANILMTQLWESLSLIDSKIDYLYSKHKNKMCHRIAWNFQLPEDPQNLEYSADDKIT